MEVFYEKVNYFIMCHQLTLSFGGIAFGEPLKAGVKDHVIIDNCSASIGLYTSATSASSLNDLLGTSYSIGASFADELAVGGSYDFCDKYKGGTIYTGIGLGECVDVTEGETFTLWDFNKYDVVEGWCDDILAW